jgi:hypothetical protein
MKLVFGLIDPEAKFLFGFNFCLDVKFIFIIGSGSCKANNPPYN